MKQNIQNIINALEVTKNHADVIDIDMGDVGNVIGMEIQKSIDDDQGTLNEFLKGLNHGVKLIKDSN